MHTVDMVKFEGVVVKKVGALHMWWSSDYHHRPGFDSAHRAVGGAAYSAVNTVQIKFLLTTRHSKAKNCGFESGSFHRR